MENTHPGVFLKIRKLFKMFLYIMKAYQKSFQKTYSVKKILSLNPDGTDDVMAQDGLISVDGLFI